MNIEFIDDTTVLIKESIEWVPTRPKNKETITSNEIVSIFMAAHKNLEITSITGPNRICNFHTEEDSMGEWTLKVKNKNKKNAPKQKSKVSTKTFNKKEG